MGVAAPSPFLFTLRSSLSSLSGQGTPRGRAGLGEGGLRFPGSHPPPTSLGAGSPVGSSLPPRSGLCVGRRRLGWGRGAGEALVGAPASRPPLRGEVVGPQPRSRQARFSVRPPYARRRGKRKSRRFGVGVRGRGRGRQSNFKVSQEVFFRASEVIPPRARILRWSPSTQQA